MSEKNESKGRLSCELNPCEDGRTECKMRIEGSLNGLLNAYANITRELMKAIIEAEGKRTAMALYSVVQMHALEEAGIDVEEEAEEAIQKTEELKKKMERKDAILDGLKSILGKTFAMPDQKDGAAE